MTVHIELKGKQELTCCFAAVDFLIKRLQVAPLNQPLLKLSMFHGNALNRARSIRAVYVLLLRGVADIQRNLTYLR